MSNIVKNYFRVLEVISSLGCQLEYKYGVGKREKTPDLEIVAIRLTAEFMSIDSENSLFKKINKQQIPNLIKRKPVQQKKKKTIFVLEEVRTKLVSRFSEFGDYFIVASMPLEICKFAPAFHHPKNSSFRRYRHSACSGRNHDSQCSLYARRARYFRTVFPN